MNTIIKQLKRYAQGTHLSAEEKTAMRDVLIRYIVAHPARESAYQSRSIPSPFSLEVLRSRKSLAALVIGGLLAGGSVSFAAEGTVPGDMLYPIKVRVNEPMRGVFAVTPQTKALWEVRLVERRLEEIEKIASLPGRSSSERQAIQKRLEDHTVVARKRIADLKERGDEDRALAAAEHFTEVLQEHEAVLEDLNEKAMLKKINMLLDEDIMDDVQPSTEREDDDSAGTLEETVKKIRNVRGDIEKDKGEKRGRPEEMRTRQNAGR